MIGHEFRALAELSHELRSRFRRSRPIFHCLAELRWQPQQLADEARATGRAMRYQQQTLMGARLWRFQIGMLGRCMHRLSIAPFALIA